MKLVEMDGLTGKVKFDQEGLRTDFTLEIIDLKKAGLTKVGFGRVRSFAPFLKIKDNNQKITIKRRKNKELRMLSNHSLAVKQFLE